MVPKCIILTIVFDKSGQNYSKNGKNYGFLNELIN